MDIALLHSNRVAKMEGYCTAAAFIDFAVKYAQIVAVDSLNPQDAAAIELASHNPGLIHIIHRNHTAGANPCIHGMPHLHIADNQAGECIKAKHIGIARLCYNRNLLRALCLNAQAVGTLYHQFKAVKAALPMVIFAAQATIVGRLRQIVLTRLKENGYVRYNSCQELIHIGDMNLAVLSGLKMGCLRKLCRLP